ncbi:hypothetical protein [Pseudoalteromonas luteoviolacea]|uniref:Uncharacterized protein n=1 Tax=Pseudoalteromonas luteoviolacea (strain 2ta16) TaxID=1353533 RepID=V4HIB4_PSEL2|nr:hypothetical protein [Pseudoalteromonas luteoviolacea]ESP90525.1 hypothetical protein PL2TA16_01629 [Pseudoalteromonas luteoviolacea 2ta16]KZN41907.1 hypothetical protein N483_14645 [Pseudoalteromonas luteoviolacea NCIMB 1944]
MDLQNPDLILVKRLSEHSCSYFAVESIAGTDVVLTDIESGGLFNFAKPRLEQLVSNGHLRTIARRELPTKLTFKPLNNVKKPEMEAAEDLASRKEMERRYKYVQGAIEQSVPAYTEKWLTPYITQKAAEINDSSPPSWRTLAHWNKTFVESGWDKHALMPRHKAKGNRTKQLPQEVHNLIDEVINEYLRTHTVVRYQKVYDQLLEQLEKLNAERREAD